MLGVLREVAGGDLDVHVDGVLHVLEIHVLEIVLETVEAVAEGILEGIRVRVGRHCSSETSGRVGICAEYGGRHGGREEIEERLRLDLIGVKGRL